MELLKITATLLLLVHVFHPVLLQETTDTPRRTIPQSWFRELAGKKKVDSQTEDTGGPASDVQPTDDTATDSGKEFSGGIASGSMLFTDEDNFNETLEYTTSAPIFPNQTTMQSEIQDSNDSTTQLPINQLNMTDTEMTNSTATTTVPEYTTMPPNSTVSSYFNSTDTETTTAAPDSNVTEETPADSGLDMGLNNKTQSNVTTTTAAPVPETTEQVTTASSTTAVPLENTTTLLRTTTSAPATPERANISNKGAALGDTAERGFASDSPQQRRNNAWGAVLGTAVAVAFVGLVAYIILKKKHHKAFSHRKLVEEFPSDPVLRLDNSEPLDLNFGRAAYYNPALQGDNILMSNFPGRSRN